MLFRGSKLKNNNTLLFELVKLKKTKYLYILDWRPFSLDMAKLLFGYRFSELYSLKNCYFLYLKKPSNIWWAKFKKKSNKYFQ